MTAAPKLGRRPKDGAYFTASMVIPTPAGKVDLGLLARALLGGVTATPLGEGQYEVTSASGYGRGSYHVQLHGEAASCDCEAGHHDMACKHVATCRFLAAILNDVVTTERR